MRLVVQQRLPRLQVHAALDARLWATRGYAVLRSDDAGAHWIRVATLPMGGMKSLLSRLELPARLLRAGIHALLPLGEDVVAVADGALYRISGRTGTVEKLCAFPHGKRPLRRGICVLDDAIYFGDYFSNPERRAVRVYRIDLQDGCLSIVYEFPPHSVRHIHLVQPDADGRRLWIGTGDSDSECRLLLLDPLSGDVERIGDGSQQWRAVSLAADDAGIIWGTDNHLGANHLWRWDRGSRTPVCLGPVTGPAYYHTRLPGALVFGTTMEKGEGEQDGYARLYAVNGCSVPRELWRLPKDKWDARYFGYGLFEFAEGTGADHRFWVTARGLQGGLCSYLLALEEDAHG